VLTRLGSPSASVVTTKPRAGLAGCLFGCKWRDEDYFGAPFAFSQQVRRDLIL
jgi:hypothetical protein